MLDDLAAVLARKSSPAVVSTGAGTQEQDCCVSDCFWGSCRSFHKGSGAVQLGVGNSTFSSLKTNNTSDAIAAHPVIATAVISRNLRVFILVKQ